MDTTRVTGNRARGRGLARAALASVLVVVMMMSVGPVSASERPDAGGPGPAVRADDPWTSGNDGYALWFWPEGRRIYQLAKPGGQLDQLKAYDADTAQEVATSGTLKPPPWSRDLAGFERYSGRGRHLVADVDREHGRVFVVYERDVRAVDGGRQLPCPGSWGTGVYAACVGGIHVLDGRDLEPLGRIPLELPTLEGPRVVVIPRATVYAPAVAERNWGGRVLLLVEELVAGPLEGNTVIGPMGNNTVPRMNGGNLAYLVAFDPDSMRQEWSVRVEGCRNSREARGWTTASEGHPAVVFRTGGEDPAVVVGCHGNAAQQGVVVRVPLDADGFPATLPATVSAPAPSAGLDGAEPQPAQVVRAAPRQEVYPGPDKVTVMLADPVSQRVLMRVDDQGEVWWVFDAAARQYLGTIGIGDYQHGHTTFGLDPDIGRLYVLAATPQERELGAPGGLYLADVRRNPLAQALHFPDLADKARNADPLSKDGGGGTAGRTMSVQPRAGGEATRIFQTESKGDGTMFRVLVDASPAGVDAVEETGVTRTFDLAEADGVTDATFDGTARGFGFRTIMIGGVEGAARVGQADPVGLARGVPQFQPGNNSTVQPPLELAHLVTQTLPRPDPCTDAQRELVLAFAGPTEPAVVDASSARGQTQPVLVDVRTADDLDAPVTRCLPVGWERLWETALVSRPPVEEPGVPWPFDDTRSSCTATDESASEAKNDPVTGMFSSRAACGPDEVAGWSQARGVSLDGVTVGAAVSSFRIYRDPARGMVARVDSIARGIDIGGVVKIDTVRGSAESWANGRLPREDSEEAAVAGDPEANPFNCDTERPAGTCFQRHIFGVTVSGPDGGAGYRCGPCGDEGALIEGMNRAFGAYASARLRSPDPELARGSADGYIAAITKRDTERFSDIVLNSDLLETMVPMLEIVRYAPHNRPSSDTGVRYSFGTAPRGRQVYQFAAVEVSSTYGIQCLLVYDEATGTCAEEAEVPGSIQVSLSDPEGAPLAGGAFELRADVDADGVLGLKDTLLQDGACVTAEDGVGTCTFEGLAPGSYLVNQVAAPPGYAKSAEPWVSEVASGEQRIVAFTNVSNVSTIDMTVTDDAGAPLSGAMFAAYPDPDSDGKVAPDAEPAATCTTDAAGVCSMQVPAGSYVLVQTGAPGGLEGIEPVAFTFASGGQVAAVTVVNYPPSQPAAPEGSASPEIAYTAPVGYSPPVESIDDTYIPADSVGQPATAGPSVPEQIGGTVVRVIRAPGDALRLFARDPQQAVAFTAALALLVLALLAVRRRQLLGGLTAVPAFAFTGGGTPPPAPPRPQGPSGGGGPSGGSSGGSSGGPSGGSVGPSGGSDGSSGGPDGPSGTDGPNGPAGDAPAASSDTPSASASSMHAATAVLERPPFVAGAAPSALERASARIIVATSHPVLAALATQRLVDAPSCDVVAVADSLEALRRALTEHTPDVVVVDLALPTGKRKDVCDILAPLHPAERTIGLIPPDRAIEALITRGHAAGLGGLLATEEDLTNGQLGYAVRCVSVGKTFFGPTVQTVLRRSPPPPPGAPPLTPRQLEVARLAARGLARADIAEQLFLSPATVKLHLAEVRKRLGVANPWDPSQLRTRLDEKGLLEDADYPDE